MDKNGESLNRSSYQADLALAHLLALLVQPIHAIGYWGEACPERKRHEIE